MHLVWTVLKTDWIKLDPQGWVSSWTSLLNTRPCHAGWPQGKATQGKHCCNRCGDLLQRRSTRRVFSSRGGSISPLPISIWYWYFWSQISVISTSFTEALFGLLTCSPTYSQWRQCYSQCGNCRGLGGSTPPLNVFNPPSCARLFVLGVIIIIISDVTPQIARTYDLYAFKH